MLARAYRTVHASVGDTVTHLEIERLYGEEQDGFKAYRHMINETSQKFDETCIEASFVKEVKKIGLLSQGQGAKSGAESHIHEYVEKLLLINRKLEDSCFEMPEKLLCFHVLQSTHTNLHFVSG